MNCQRKGCTNTADSAIALNIPAKNIPLAEHDPIRVTIGLCVCAGCLAELSAAKFLAADSRIRQLTSRITEARNLAEPDFDRAFLSPLAFDSPEWIGMQARKPPPP